MVVTWSKGQVWEPITLIQHYCGVDTSSASGGVFYLSHDPTRPLRWDVNHIEKFGDHRYSDS